MRKINLTLSFFLCGSASFLALYKLNYPLIGIDDANIYFVYARNLANGYGFVYNIGGEKVEGFTSLLWTLISALAFKVFTSPELTLLIINIVLVSLGIAYALGYLQHCLSGKEDKRGTQLFWSALFLILVFTSPRYIIWNTITLMENALWSTLLLVTTIFVIRDPPSSRRIYFGFVPLSILLLLTRPESILWVAVFTAILFLRTASTTSTGNIINALKSLMPAIICIVLSLVLLTLFRLQYFGYPLPNTYYAKVSSSLAYNLEQGVIYLSKYFISDPIVLLCIIAVFVSCLRAIAMIFSKQIPNDGSFFLPMIAATGLLAPLLTGGDHFGSFRLYQNIYPIEILCLLYFANHIQPDHIRPFEHSRVSQWKRASAVFAVATGGVFLSQLSVWNSITSEMDIEFAVADYGRKNGTFVQKLFSHLTELPSLGVVTSGGIKYSYAGEIVDLMGLNNITMAHNHTDRKGIKNHAAFDINTFYLLQPDVVWPLTVQADKWQYSESEIKESWENARGLKGLFDEPVFQESYTYASVSNKTGKGYILVAWFRKDFLKDLTADTKFLVKEYEYTP